MSRREVSELFGVTSQTFANYASRGILKEVTDSKHHFLTRESVERVLEDMRMDDMIQKEIADLHQKLEEEKASAKQHLREAQKGNTIISLLGSKGGRDAVVAVIRSMGHRYLSASIVNSAIAFLEGWNIERMRGEFGVNSMQSMRVRLYRVLKTLKSLPSYSDLEQDIDLLIEERDGLKYYINQLKAERAQLAEQLGKKLKVEGDPCMARLRLYGRGVEELNIQTKYIRALYAYGIEKVGDLVKLSGIDLVRRVKSLGMTGIQQVDEALEAWGLRLRSE